MFITMRPWRTFGEPGGDTHLGRFDPIHAACVFSSFCPHVPFPYGTSYRRGECVVGAPCTVCGFGSLFIPGIMHLMNLLSPRLSLCCVYGCRQRRRHRHRHHHRYHHRHHHPRLHHRLVVWQLWFLSSECSSLSSQVSHAVQQYSYSVTHQHDGSMFNPFEVSYRI